MAETTPMGSAISFMERLGVYEVVLPFLLVFTLVFAILEKSRVFGVETIDGTKYTKKNLNSMFAFVTALLVVASTRLVAAINEAVANMVLLLVLGVSFTLLAGTFHTGEKEFELKGFYKTVFIIIMFVSILLIFLHAIRTADGTPWLIVGWEFLVNHYDEGAFGALILTLALVGLMVWITADRKAPSAKKEED